MLADLAIMESQLFRYLLGSAWYWATVSGMTDTVRFSVASSSTLPDVVMLEAFSITLRSELSRSNLTEPAYMHVCAINNFIVMIKLNSYRLNHF